jgi:Kef-type K+ transport system membrane component KefB
MPDVSFTNLLVVAAVAVLAPLTVGFAPRLRIPAVVLEIIGGIIIGPSGFGWVHVDLPVAILALFGLAFLLFLAGLEIDVHRLRGRLLGYAVLGYLVGLVLGYGAGVSFQAAGWVSQPLLIAITLSATALGLVVPVLKDAGQVHSQVGQTALAAASVADFTAIVLLSLFFSSSGGSTGSKVVVLGAFAGLVAVTGLVVSGAARSMRLGQVLVRLQDTTAEIRVRCAVLLLVAFTALAERFGLESILGAFLAGAIVGLVDRDSASHPQFRAKLDAIGYGFLVPVFFVSSGIRLDLTGLLHSPSALVRVPVFLLALLVARGVPALLGLRANGPRATLALGLLQATSLPFIVTITQIGVALGKITPVTAAALVCAGLLSVLIFPLLALGLLRRNEPAPAPPAPAPPAPAPAVTQPVPEPHLM